MLGGRTTLSRKICFQENILRDLFEHTNKSVVISHSLSFSSNFHPINFEQVEDKVHSKTLDNSIIRTREPYSINMFSHPLLQGKIFCNLHTFLLKFLTEFNIFCGHCVVDNFQSVLCKNLFCIGTFPGDTCKLPRIGNIRQWEKSPSHCGKPQKSKHQVAKLMSFFPACWLQKLFILRQFFLWSAHQPFSSWRKWYFVVGKKLF